MHIDEFTQKQSAIKKYEILSIILWVVLFFAGERIASMAGASIGVATGIGMAASIMGQVIQVALLSRHRAKLKRTD